MTHSLPFLTALLLAPLAALHATEVLLRTETWTEKRPDASGKMETRTVTAEVWTQAMQADLDAERLEHVLPQVGGPQLEIHAVFIGQRRLARRTRAFLDFVAGNLLASLKTA